MWMSYEETRWPKAVDCKSTIERLEKNLDACYREFVLDGNRPEYDREEVDENYRRKRYQEFDIALEAVENYHRNRITLEKLVDVLVQVKMQGYLVIDHLPYYIVRKFDLDGMTHTEKDDKKYDVEEETCDCQH